MKEQMLQMNQYTAGCLASANISQPSWLVGSCFMMHAHPRLNTSSDSNNSWHKKQCGAAVCEMQLGRLDMHAMVFRQNMLMFIPSHC